MFGWAAINDEKVKGGLTTLGMFVQWRKEGHVMMVVSRPVVGQGVEYYTEQSL
jgi:hypothetical protein